MLQAFLDLSLLDAQDVKVPFLQAKKQGQAALLNYSRRTLEEQVEKGFENKGKVSPTSSVLLRRAGQKVFMHTKGPASIGLLRFDHKQASQEDRASRLERSAQFMRAQLAQLEQSPSVSWPSPLTPLQQCVLSC